FKKCWTLRRRRRRVSVPASMVKRSVTLDYSVQVPHDWNPKAIRLFLPMRRSRRTSGGCKHGVAERSLPRTTDFENHATWGPGALLDGPLELVELPQHGPISRLLSVVSLPEDDTIEEVFADPGPDPGIDRRVEEQPMIDVESILGSLVETRDHP